MQATMHSLYRTSKKAKAPKFQHSWSTWARAFSLSFSDTYPVQYICPALHRDALKHRQHGKSKIVKVRNAVLRSLPACLALGAILTLPPMRRLGGTGRRIIFCRCILKERREKTEMKRTNCYWALISEWRISDFNKYILQWIWQLSLGIRKKLY